MLQDPGAGNTNSQVFSLIPQDRTGVLYRRAVTGNNAAPEKWLFGTSAGHQDVFVLRAEEAGGVLTAGSADEDYRVAPLGTDVSALTMAAFEALPLAKNHGALLTDNTFLFISAIVLNQQTGDPVPNFKNSGTMRCGREFEADSLSFTHTTLQQRFGSSDAVFDELRLRGLSVELPGIFASHGISHSSSGAGGEHGRQPHVNIHIEDGKKTTSVDRHNIHYSSLRIPHEIDYKYVYTDTGEPVTDEHGDTIGKCCLTSQFTGFVL